MLMPFARRRTVRAGQVLFRAGDPADHLYFIVSGRMRVEPVGVELGPGELFGEIAFFSRERQRTQTVRVAQAGTLLALDEASLLRLYHENPTFSFRISEMITTRLVDNLRRLQEAARDDPDRGRAGEGGDGA
jgi:CRP-like cAMP-binding protein